MLLPAIFILLTVSHSALVEKASKLYESVAESDESAAEHLLGSIPLIELLRNQNLQETWRKIHPNKISYTYHRTLSNIHSRLDRIYSSQNLIIIDSKILPFQYPDHDALFAEFFLRVRTRGPEYWKLNTSILTTKPFV